MEFPLTDIEDVQSTKEKILLVAVQMFSERGYTAVSVKDIAERVEIKAPSVYAHYENKEALFAEIVETIRRVYMDFYGRVDAEIDRANGFAEVLRCLFAELKEVYHIFIYHGVSLLATEQFRSEKAREVFNEVYLKIGIDYSAQMFDRCIEKGWVKPFDTRTLATLFMHTVFVGTLMRAQENMGFEPIYDVTEMFSDVERFMLSSVEVID